MTMADSDALAVATSEGTTTDEGTQQSDGYTAEELGRIVDERVSELLHDFGRGFQSQLDKRLTPLEQTQAMVREVLPRTARTEAIIERMAKGSLLESDLEEIDSGLKAKQERAEAEAVKAEYEALKKERETSTRGFTQEEVNSMAMAAYEGTFRDILVADAEENNIEYSKEVEAEVLALQVPIDAKTNTFRWAEWMKKAKAIVRKHGDNAEEDSRPSPRIVRERNTGNTQTLVGEQALDAFLKQRRAS